MNFRKWMRYSNLIVDGKNINLKNHKVSGRRNVCEVLYSVFQKDMEQLVKHFMVTQISRIGLGDCFRNDIMLVQIQHLKQKTWPVISESGLNPCPSGNMESGSSQGWKIWLEGARYP